ncbi:unnamed protein product [Chironomus riparius]|uniref:Uncharacterized protein n=1 Tax=Chironomus riparius TaxID=315576 RepID=A0A9N9S081_9DIPT|nr:unnamed protein product [Chironomus riparius]
MLKMTMSINAVPRLIGRNVGMIQYAILGGSYNLAEFEGACKQSSKISGIGN